MNLEYGKQRWRADVSSMSRASKPKKNANDDNANLLKVPFDIKSKDRPLQSLPRAKSYSPNSSNDKLHQERAQNVEVTRRVRFLIDGEGGTSSRPLDIVDAGRSRDMIDQALNICNQPNCSLSPPPPPRRKLSMAFSY